MAKEDRKLFGAKHSNTMQEPVTIHVKKVDRFQTKIRRTRSMFTMLMVANFNQLCVIAWVAISNILNSAKQINAL
jgi:hypothetical protein